MNRANRKVNPACSGTPLPVAEAYLSQSCEVMAQLINLHGPCLIADSEYRPFQTLVSSIISQQLSAKAASTIKQRILAIVPDLSPAELLAVPHDSLRTAGLSSAKTRYIIELARRTNEGRLNFETLQRQVDEDVIATLMELPGIGRWTSEMFLVFGLKRPDVLALGDAGLQRATRLLYGENANLENTSKRWRPYASTASWYLWRHLDS